MAETKSKAGLVYKGFQDVLLVSGVAVTLCFMFSAMARGCEASHETRRKVIDSGGFYDAGSGIFIVWPDAASKKGGA